MRLSYKLPELLRCPDVYDYNDGKIGCAGEGAMPHKL